MNNSFNDFILKNTDHRMILWMGVDDGSFLGKFSLKPTHVYLIYRDENGVAQYVCESVENYNTAVANAAGSHAGIENSSGTNVHSGILRPKIKQCNAWDNWKTRKLVNAYRKPESTLARGMIYGLLGGFFMTVASILTSMILAQIALDEEKQEEIHQEAQKAIAMCSATQAVTAGDFDEAERQLDIALAVDPSLDNDKLAKIDDLAIDNTNTTELQQSGQEELWMPGNSSTNNALPASDGASQDMWMPK